MEPITGSSATVAVLQLEAVISMMSRLDFLWNLFISVNLGLLVLLFTATRPIRIWEYLLALPGYLLFLYINFHSLNLAYDLTGKMYYDINIKMSRSSDFEKTREFFSDRSFVESKDLIKNRHNALYITHGLALVLIITVAAARDTARLGSIGRIVVFPYVGVVKFIRSRRQHRISSSEGSG